MAEDLRQDGDSRGAFGLLADVLYNTSLIDVTGIQHLSPVDQAVSGTVDDANSMVVNAGGLDGVQEPASRDPQALLILDAVAVAPGTLVVESEFGEHDVIMNLLFGVDTDVTPLTDFRSRSIEIGFADLVTTSLDVVPDHVLAGATTVTFTVVNQGDVATPDFEAELIHGAALTPGPDDRSVKTVTISGLLPNESTEVTVDLKLDVPTLFRRALADDPAGLPDGHVSESDEFIRVVLDPRNEIDESNERNNADQGLGVDRDNVAYFPFDVDADRLVTGLDAIFVINRLGESVPGADARADLDGDRFVTELDAIAIINRFGYAVNPRAHFKSVLV